MYQYQDAFESYGIQLSFQDDALKAISKLAYIEKTGARSLMTIIERILRDFKFEMPSLSIKELDIDESIVVDPAIFLSKLLKEHSQ